jgi:hypothetical protein
MVKRKPKSKPAKRGNKDDIIERGLKYYRTNFPAEEQNKDHLDLQRKYLSEYSRLTQIQNELYEEGEETEAPRKWESSAKIPIHMDRPGHLGIDNIIEIKERHPSESDEKEIKTKKVFLQTVEEVELSDDCGNEDMISEVSRRRIEVKDCT